jgi:hypothetical protein
MGKPNITSTIAGTALLLYDDRGIFVRQTEPPKSKVAWVLEVINDASNTKRRGGSTGKIIAKLTFRLGYWTRVFSPGTWVSQYFSSVDIAPGETKELILALHQGQPGNPITSDWRAIINRRGDSGEAVSIDRQEIAMFGRGTILVEIISSASGKVIGSFELGWVWQSADGTTGGVTYIKQLS